MLVLLLALAAVRGESFAQDDRPRLESATCPFQEPALTVEPECSWLVVPEDRGREDGPSVRLFVVVLRAGTSGELPPLVSLHGGPALSALEPMVRAVSRQAPLERDYVIYDQRGAGLSRPDPCPGFAGRVRELEAEESPETRRSALHTVARECTDFMRLQGIDPASYSTAANAADLIDLRAALGYGRWDLYGTSYGARLALEAMRRDSLGIRAVVLDAPLPPGPVSAEAPLWTQNALERVFASCGRSETCRVAFPALEEAFVSSFHALARAPISATAREGSGPVELDGAGFVLAVRRLLRTRATIASLPLLLHELHAGDRPRAAQEIVRLADAASERADRSTFWLVLCNDQYGPEHVAHRDSVRSMVWEPLGALPDNLEECPAWQSGARAEVRAEVASRIPTLILAGELDAVAPVEAARRIASTLSRTWLFELPGETHGGQPAGCRVAMLREFLGNPWREPDSSCIARMEPIEFRIRWPE